MCIRDRYATYFMTIINIPLTLSSTAPTSMIPEVSALYATGDIEATRECIDPVSYTHLVSRLVRSLGVCGWLPQLQSPRRNQYKP